MFMKNLIYGNVFLENNISNSSQNILTFFHLLPLLPFTSSEAEVNYSSPVQRKLLESGLKKLYKRLAFPPLHRNFYIYLGKKNKICSFNKLNTFFFNNNFYFALFAK